VKRHATDEELACLAVGALKPRKAAKVEAHLTSCLHCQQVSRDLVSVSTTLASVSIQYPPIPDYLSVRIDTALRTEVIQRLSSEPASEAGRRDLPSRSRRSPSKRGGWRLPGLSAPVTRLVAAAGALVIIGAGGYEVATHVVTNGGTSASPSTGGAAIQHAGAAKPVAGPEVTYQTHGSTHSIRAVHSNTDFVRSRLGVQVIAAVREARKQGALPMSLTHASSRPSPDQVSNGSADTAPSATSRSTLGVGPDDAKLDGCVQNVAASRTVLLVALAKFQGSQATIIVLGATPSQSAEVWVVGATCSASTKDALVHLDVART
jgi:hypothetical protein